MLGFFGHGAKTIRSMELHGGANGMKRVIALLGMLSLMVALSAPVPAQEATPQAAEALLAAWGYPELHVLAGDDGVEMPAQVNAGRTLIVYENVGSDSFHPMMLRLPDDVSVDQAMVDLGPDAMEPPGWFLEAEFPGFVGETLPGQTSYAVVDLKAGMHLILHDSAAAIEVVDTGDSTPISAGPPTVDGTVNLFEMGFAFPDTITQGDQVWEVTNTGELPHELLLLQSTEPITPDQIVELFMSEDEAATPVGGGPSLAQIEPVGGLGWLSPGATAWTEVTLDPGFYGAVCFVFDPETGMPHLMLGMVAVFTVGDVGTPVVATPAG